MAWEQAINLIPIGVSFVLAYIGVNIDDDNQPLKLLFILMALWLLVISVANAVEIVESLASAEVEIINNLENGYKAIMYTTLLGTAYYIIMMLWRFMSWLVEIVK